MLNSHEITDGLPAPRDDEPSSLRRDIADEILDHLQASLRRELLVRGGDENFAWKRVIEHFGDPRQVARRLWFQAMWSKIMTQRLVVVSALVSMTLSVVLTALVGWMIHGQQQTNAALVDQMSKLILQQSSPAPERDPRWNNLKIKATLGTKNGPAAEGLEVTVSKVPDIGDVIPDENENNTAAKTAVRKKHKAKTDAQGLVDCGFVVPGLYELEIDSPTRESYSSTFTIYPGHDHVEEIVAPAKPPELTDVSLQLEGLPADLDAKKYGLILSFHQIGDRTIDGRSWSSSAWFPFEATPFVMIVPGRGVWRADIPHNSERRHRWPVAIFYPQTGPAAQWKRLEPPYRLQIPAHAYSVCFDFVRVPPEMTPDDPEWNRNMLHDSQDTTVAWPSGEPRSFGDPHVITLVAGPGQRNDWTLELPSALLAAWEQRAAAYPGKSSPLITASIGNRGGSRFGGGGSSRSAFLRTPSLLNEPGNQSELWQRLDLTSHQQSQLEDLSRRRSQLRPVGFNPPSPELKEKIEAQSSELDLKAAEILTSEQNKIWEECRAKLIQLQVEDDLATLKGGEDGAIERSRLDNYLQAAKLTAEQAQKLIEIEGQLDAERRKLVEANKQISQDEQRQNWLPKFQEYDKQFAECLTAEQKAALSRRTARPGQAPR